MNSSYSIPIEKILERLRFENPWWITGAIEPDLDSMKRRLYFNLFIPLIKAEKFRRAVILMGPRRVGKTVMMHHSIADLLKTGLPPANIHFIGIDNPIYINMGLDELYKLARQASKQDHTEGQFVFFDEIQYLKDWERHLKVLVDSYPKTRFIVSGSAAAALKLKSTESGAGRFHDFMLPPLTFQEFLDLQDLQGLIKPTLTTYDGKEAPFYTAYDIKDLNRHFFRYLNYGGYPEVIFNDYIRKNMSSYVKNDIIDKVLLRDLPSLYGIRNVQELNRFFAYIAYNTGKEFSLQKMAKDSGLDKSLLKKYLEYLEAAFLVKVVHKVDDTVRHFKRVTGFKIYLTNASLRTALFSPVEPSDQEAGNVVETAIYAQWLHRKEELYYAKWKSGRKEGEVDIISIDNKRLKPAWAVEVKWSDRYTTKPGELKSLLEFCNKNQLTTAVVTSITKEEVLEHQGVMLHFYPVAVYAYAVGANTMVAPVL